MEHRAQNHCFGCGPANASGLQLEYMVAEDLSVVCLAAIPAGFEGPSGYLHGGIIATMLDETMSKSLRARGITSLTRQMVVEYLRPIHSGAPLRLEGRLVRSEDKRHWTEARIVSPKGHIMAEAKGLFVEVRTGHSS
jgi:uncharacterized protein (TIGR00369 family)